MNKTDYRRTPKQERSQERYAKILDTAANLFLDKGFDGTTTNEIARRAEISIGSLYQYFDNKTQDLLLFLWGKDDDDNLKWNPTHLPG